MATKITRLLTHCTCIATKSLWPTTTIANVRPLVEGAWDSALQEHISDPSNVSVNLTLHRTWLTQKEVYLSKYTGIDVNSLLWGLEKYDVYDAILDPKLTPELPTAKKLPSAMVQVAWSPAGVLPHRRYLTHILSVCVLATVCNYGSVALHGGSGLSWRELANLSERYLELCRESWEDVGTNCKLEQQFEVQRQRVAEITTTSVCWGTLGKDYAYFVCAQTNGCILIWKVHVTKALVTTVLECELVTTVTVENSLGRIMCLQWCPLKDGNSLLLAGGYNGRVSGWLVSEREGLLTCMERAVWPDEDRMSVTQLVPLPQARPLVLAAKGAYILLLQFDDAGSKTAVLPQRMGNLEVTGVVALDEGTALVATHSGRMVRLCVADGPAGLSVHLEDVQLDVNTSHWTMCGLATSRSKMLLAVACRVCKAYDHLVHREPAQICFFKQPADMDDLMSVIMNNPSQKLTEFWEHLEVIRLQCLVEGCVPGVQFATEQQGLELYTSYQLRIAVTVLKMVLSQSDSADAIVLLRRRLERMSFLLFVRHVCGLMSCLAEAAAATAADKGQLAILGTIRLWLAGVLARGEVEGPRTTRLVREACDLPRLPGELQEEFCHICCATQCPVDSHLHVSCVVGHQLPRCSLTMRPCSSVPYLRCPTCGAVARLDSEWQDEEVLCIYCDKNFVVDEKIRVTPLPLPSPSREGKS